MTYHVCSWHIGSSTLQMALLCVLSDIFATTDHQDVMLLRVSAAFNWVNHDVLLCCMEQSYGIRGMVLTWIMSFLYGCTQQVVYVGRLSFVAQLVYGVP